MKTRLKEICRERGITQKELAQTLGVTEITITRFNKGNFSVGLLETIASALNVPISSLFEAESANVIVCPHCGKSIHLHPSKEETITETAETANQ